MYDFGIAPELLVAPTFALVVSSWSFSFLFDAGMLCTCLSSVFVGFLFLLKEGLISSQSSMSSGSVENLLEVETFVMFSFDEILEADLGVVK